MHGQYASYWNAFLLPPATKLGQGNIFRSVCPHSVHRGGMRGCSGVAYMVAPRGACMVAPQGACMVAPGGVHGCSGWACMVAPWGACMVAPRGHAWLLRVVCMVALGGGWLLRSIRSMSGRYASYWNAFLLDIIFA